MIMEEEEPKETYRPTEDTRRRDWEAAAEDVRRRDWEAATEDTRRRDWEVTKEEREFLLSGKKKADPEEEAVFNAVMQEYFS